MLDTLEKPTSNHETEKRYLTDDEVAAANERRNRDLNADLYGNHTLLGPQTVDTEAVYRSSETASTEVSKEAWLDATKDNLPVDKYDAVEDIYDLTNDVQAELAENGSSSATSESAVESRVLGGHIDQQFQDGITGERLDKENAAKVKNALIGQRYMEAWINKSPEDIDLLKKLPVEVFSEVSLRAYQLQQGYGASDKVTNKDMALVGEIIIATAVDSTQDDEEPKLVYGDEEGNLVIQTPEQAIEQIELGDESVISSINDPELKVEIKNYVSSMNVFYESGITSADPDERNKLKQYLVEAFQVKQTIE